jgi:hypothetical protein
MNALDLKQGFDFAMGQMGACLIGSLVAFAIVLIPLAIRIAWIWWKGGKK